MKNHKLLYIPLFLLALVVCVQVLILRPHYGISKWKGGGYAVYCTASEKRIVTYVEVGGKFIVTKSTYEPSAKVFHELFAYVPLVTDEGLNKYAESLIGKFFLVEKNPNKKIQSIAYIQNSPDSSSAVFLATRVKVEVWKYHYTEDMSKAQYRLMKRVVV